MNRREFIAKAAVVGLGTLLLPGCARLSGPQPAAEKIPPVSASSVSAPTTELIVVQGSDPASMLERGLKALGGIERFVKPGNKVVLKPNFSVPRTPEEAATTNPVLVGALTRLCLAAGAKEVRVVDYPFSSPVICLEKSGLKRAVTAAGGNIYTFNGGQERYFQKVRIGGQALAEVEFAKDVLESDVFINMPILKHHSGAKLTMGLKNMMGLVWDRGQFHAGHLERAIAELAACRKPNLVIMDALRGITANGPMGPGPVREYNQLVLGGDPVAVDAYGAALFGMKPAELEYLRLAAELGVGEIDWEKLKVQKI